MDFYRLHLQAGDMPQFAVAFPSGTLTDNDRLVAIPLRAPMGWTHSPPCFCSATETIADLANANILSGSTLLLIVWTLLRIPHLSSR